MKRFENAQVSDEVYCRLRGEGIIKSITYSERYPLECLFYDHCTSFDHDGRSQKDHFEPTLFYRKGPEKHLTERPEPKIDWSKVPMGTKVFVSDDESILKTNDAAIKETFLFYLPDYEYPYWVLDGMYNDKAAGFKYCKLGFLS